MQLKRESYRKADDNHDGLGDRSGFSMLLLAEEHRGIELAFWPNRVWAQGDGKKLFTQAEGADTVTDDAMHHSVLRLDSSNYTLLQDGKVLLSGHLRDSSAFRGSPNPYRLKNFVFLGDDSQRSGAQVMLGSVWLVEGDL